DRDWSSDVCSSDLEEAVREFYDSIWVYGDPSVYDVAREYGFSREVAAKIRYTGYLDQRSRLELADDKGAPPIGRLNLPPGRLALCFLGGGQDGALLAEAFARAELPPGWNGVIVTGPFIDPEVESWLRGSTQENPSLRTF